MISAAKIVAKRGNAKSSRKTISRGQLTLDRFFTVRGGRDDDALSYTSTSSSDDESVQLPPPPKKAKATGVLPAKKGSPVAVAATTMTETMAHAQKKEAKDKLPKGVSWSCRKYRARVQFAGNKRSLGVYHTPEMAGRVVEVAEAYLRKHGNGVTKHPPKDEVDSIMTEARKAVEEAVAGFDVAILEHENMTLKANVEGEQKEELPKGVQKDRSKYRARVYFAGKMHSLGCYSTPEMAGRVVEVAEAYLRKHGNGVTKHSLKDEVDSIMTEARKAVEDDVGVEDEVGAKREPGEYCKKCGYTRSPANLVRDDRCYDCVSFALERITFAFHPESQHSGMTPGIAVALLEDCAYRNLSILDFGSQFHCDHSTDDRGNHAALHNRKTKNCSQIHHRKPRLQEIKHGGIKVRDASSHSCKTYSNGESSRTPKEVTLHLRRMPATELHIKGINVEDLEALLNSVFPYNEEIFDFDLQAFIEKYLPFWKAKKAKADGDGTVEAAGTAPGTFVEV